MRAAAPLAHLLHDAPRDVIAREQLGRTARVLVALRVAPAFLLVVGGLVAVVLGDVVEHEATAFAVHEDPALAAHAFGDEDSAHARRPDHSCRMELHELHVLERRARVVRERVSVAGVFPAVARDAERSADAAGGEHNGLGGEELEPSPLAVVAQRAGDAIPSLRSETIVHSMWTSIG